MTAQIPTPQADEPRGYLKFKAIRKSDGERVTYVGVMPVFNLIDQGFIAPVASAGLAPDILKVASTNGPVQRKTSSAHVQAIVDYIVDQADKGEPWAFNSIVLYSTGKLDFYITSDGIEAAGEASAGEAMSVGEGLHRCLAWAVALGISKVKGVKRPVVSPRAAKRIQQATIPVIVVEEANLGRQKTDFNRLNQQKPLTTTVLHLTDETVLSKLTRYVIEDVALFHNRIDINNASVGAKSDKLLAFAQLRFVVASYLLGKRTRSTKAINENVAMLVGRDGPPAMRAELREVFTAAALRLDGLERLQAGAVPSARGGDVVRELRHNTLLASSAAWRALFVALHESKVDAETAFERLAKHPELTWARDGTFFVGTLIDTHTGKLLSSRESIDAASDLLASVMRPSRRAVATL